MSPPLLIGCCSEDFAKCIICISCSMVIAEVKSVCCRYLVSFVMPSKYTRETLPKPNNENVKIKEVPKRTFATYAWR